MPGVDLRFDVSDLESRLPEADASVDITLCLYSVLSHLRVTSLRGVVRELGRVTREIYMRHGQFMDRTTHLVFVGRAQRLREM
jgi:hypothetical protein